MEVGDPTYHVNVIKLMRDYVDRRVTSPTWGSPPPCKQALSPQTDTIYKSPERDLPWNWVTSSDHGRFLNYWFKCTQLRAFTNANLTDSSLSYKNNLTLVSLNFSFNISGLLFWEISERRQTRNWSGFHSSSTSRMTQPPTLIRHFLDLGCEKIQWRTIIQYPSIISDHERFPFTT